MLRITLSAQDLARIQFVPRPAPLVELKLTLMMLQRPDSEQLFGRWRRKLRKQLPATTRPLWDLLSPYRGAAFIDPVTADLPTGLESVRSAPATLVRTGIEHVWAPRRGAPPSWVRELIRGEGPSRELLCRALADAHDTVLGEVWPQVMANHQAEFARYALNAAQHGVAGALNALCPGSRLVDRHWELDAPYHRHVTPAQRGLLLLPTFHWTAAPLILDTDDQPVLMVYPAGPGMPIVPTPASEDTLAPILGTTRAHALRLLTDPLSTGELAGLLGVSPGAVSTHTAALRAAGLINTARNGRAVRHELTALGTLMIKNAGKDGTTA
ncbi:ArsR/SmtB family transcription factor [Streptomyces sp. NPDC002671]